MVSINVLAEYLECTEREVFEDAYAVSFDGESGSEKVEEAYRNYVETGHCPIWVINYLCE
jgi:hypothetical protein